MIKHGKICRSDGKIISEHWWDDDNRYLQREDGPALIHYHTNGLIYFE